MVELLLVAYTVFVIRNIIVDPDPWREKIQMIAFWFFGCALVGLLTWVFPALNWFLTYRGNAPY